MQTSKQLADKILALQTEAKAIADLATGENRELSAEEATRIDAICGNDNNPGEIKALQEQRERRIKIESTVATTLNNVIANEKQETKVKIPARAKAHGKLVAFKSEEDAYSMGQFVLAALFKQPKAKRFCKDNGINATMTTGDNTTGGFLVPEPLENSIIELREQFGVFRQNSMVWPMSEAVAYVPRVAGEVSTYYVGEATSITPSDMTLNQIKLEAKKLAALAVVSSELNEDAIISVAELIARSAAYQLAVAEDQAGFLGDGTSTYGGIVGLASALQAGSLYTATSRQTFSALTFADFESVIGQCKMYPGIQPKWYIHNAGWAASMQRLMNAAGGVTMAELGGGAPASFLGYPVVKTQVLTSALTGTTGLRACYFGDLAMGSYLGSRRGITIRVDDSRYFEQDLTAIRVTQRYDINIHDRGTASVSGGIIGMVFG